jgi:hypothetical protein
MNTLMICVAAATLGIDVGWQRLPEGGTEYIIQLDPQTLETLRSGKPLHSDIPPAAGEVRSYRIIMGTQKLPRETPLPARPETSKTPQPKPSGQKESQLAAPRPLTLDAGGKSFPEQPAVFEDKTGTAPADKPQPEAEPQTVSEPPAKPWLPLTLTLLGLFASLSANVYLVWIAWDSRQRYLAKCRAGS